MRKAFIIESFDDFWDFLGIMKEVNQVVCEDREEIDMIMENGEVTFIVLIKGRLVLTSKDKCSSLSFLSLILLRKRWQN